MCIDTVHGFLLPYVSTGKCDCHCWSGWYLCVNTVLLNLARIDLAVGIVQHLHGARHEFLEVINI